MPDARTGVAVVQNDLQLITWRARLPARRTAAAPTTNSYCVVGIRRRALPVVSSDCWWAVLLLRNFCLLLLRCHHYATLYCTLKDAEMYR